MSNDIHIIAVREANLKLIGARNLMAEACTILNKVYNGKNTNDFLKHSAGVMYDGAKYAIETIESSLHDATVDLYKTEDELFVENADKIDEHNHRDLVRAIYNENKI